MIVSAQTGGTRVDVETKVMATSPEVALAAAPKKTALSIGRKAGA